MEFNSIERLYKQSNSDYLANNPLWHIEDSPWKAKQIYKIIRKNNIKPNTIVEIGCGAGEILNQLQMVLDESTQFFGYDISPDAYKLALSRNNKRLQFYNENLLEQPHKYDLLLMIDVFEHVEDYYSFIKKSAEKADYKIFHIPLELSVSFVLRNQMKVARKQYGHIHHFAKDTAIETLKDCGLEIIDYNYTASSVELKTIKNSTKIMNVFRRILYKFSPDLAARFFGGYSLLVLAK